MRRGRRGAVAIFLLIGSDEIVGRALTPGIRGLYTGLTASVFRQMTYSLTRLGVYDVIKERMSDNGELGLE